jgi:hypothetical protein
MTFIDWLSHGSEFHTAKRTENALTISAANESPECLRVFQNIVQKAKENASKEGYTINPHTSSRHSYGFDSALITFD